MKNLKWNVAKRDGEGALWVYLEVWEDGVYKGRAGSSLDASLSVQTTAATMASLATNMSCPAASYAETARVGAGCT